MVNCFSDDFINSENSRKSSESFIFKINKPLLIKSISWQDLNQEFIHKSAFTRVKSSFHSKQLTNSDMIEHQISNPLYDYRISQVPMTNLTNNSSNSGFNSSFKSVKIDTDLNSPNSSNSILRDTLYFSPISIPSNDSQENNSVEHTTKTSFNEKTDQEFLDIINTQKPLEEKRTGKQLISSPKNEKTFSNELRRTQSIEINMHKQKDKLTSYEFAAHFPNCQNSSIKYNQKLNEADLRKRACSLTNPNVLRQFQLNRKKSRIYSSSQDFLDNIDTALPMNNEACFATTHPIHHLHQLQEDRKLLCNSPKTIENKTVKILDKNHNNKADDLFTVCAVLLYVCLSYLRYWIAFFITSYFVMLYFFCKIVVLSCFSIYNITLFLFLLPLTLTKKCFQVLMDFIRLIL